MKKLTIIMCLLLLNIVLNNVRSYASFVYDIDMFEQYDGTDTFTDEFNDNNEPPSGSVSNTDYWVLGTFAPNRESGGLLELNSADGIFDEGEYVIGTDVKNSTYFFNSGEGGYVIGMFEVNDGSSPWSIFDIEIINLTSVGGDAANFDEALMEIETDDLGNKIAGWGDENNWYTQDITTDLVGITEITMKLLINSSNQVTAMWDYGSDGSFNLIQQNFTTLSFTPGDTNDIYTGGFFAAGPTQPVPVEVAIDIKPQSCPNPLNIKSKGVLPVVILGTPDFDVRMIDITSLRLNGIAPVRSAFEDVTTPSGLDPCECLALSGDGSEDLILKFNTQAIVATLDSVSKGLEIPLTLTGVLMDGIAIEGSDCIVIKGVK